MEFGPKTVKFGGNRARRARKKFGRTYFSFVKTKKSLHEGETMGIMYCVCNARLEMFADVSDLKPPCPFSHELKQESKREFPQTSIGGSKRNRKRLVEVFW